MTSSITYEDLLVFLPNWNLLDYVDQMVSIQMGYCCALVRWHSLVWDVTCLDRYVPSCYTIAICGAREVVQQVEHLKCQFVAIAIKTSHAMGPEALALFKDLGHHLY